MIYVYISEFLIVLGISIFWVKGIDSEIKHRENNTDEDDNLFP